MKKWATYYLFLVVMDTILVCNPSFSLETLTCDQMKTAVGQAGIDVAINSAGTEIYTGHITVSSPDLEPITHYMTFNGIHSITTVNTGADDESADGKLNHMSIDIGTDQASNLAMLFIQSPDLNVNTDITVDSIDFCGTQIGRLTVDDFSLTSFHLFAGPHGETGIDFELGKRTTVASLVYQYGDTSDLALKLTGITIANSFDTDGKAIGEFRIGDISNNKPASLDITYNQARDSSYVAMNLPMEGSLRIDNITFGSTDFGAMTIDGLKAEKLYIEIPGRGLGKP